MLASPRCWQLHSELLATGPASQLAVDAYAVQHPGVPERRAIQSVGAHLVSLCAAFEREWPVERATHLLRRAVDHEPGWRWLEPEPPLGSITIADVVAADDWGARSQIIGDWAADLWSVYSEHHELVRKWLDAVLDQA